MPKVKNKFPYSDALEIALRIGDRLLPFCHRFEIAGSLRRRKTEVSDIEIVYVPKFDTEKDGFFDTREVNQVDRELERMLAEGVLAKRKNVNGSEVWGEKNKLAKDVHSGIPVDLFQTTERCWWNYLVCRTGGKDSNTRIAIAAINRGLTWHPYSSGFSRKGEMEIHFPVRSERDVFRIAGVPYQDPAHRP